MDFAPLPARSGRHVARRGSVAAGTPSPGHPPPMTRTMSHTMFRVKRNGPVAEAGTRIRIRRGKGPARIAWARTGRSESLCLGEEEGRREAPLCEAGRRLPAAEPSDSVGERLGCPKASRPPQFTGQTRLAQPS